MRRGGGDTCGERERAEGGLHCFSLHFAEISSEERDGGTCVGVSSSYLFLPPSCDEQICKTEISQHLGKTAKAITTAIFALVVTVTVAEAAAVAAATLRHDIDHHHPPAWALDAHSRRVLAMQRPCRFGPRRLKLPPSGRNSAGVERQMAKKSHHR
jgi:hypothetical protein